MNKALYDLFNTKVGDPYLVYELYYFLQKEIPQFNPVTRVIRIEEVPPSRKILKLGYRSISFEINTRVSYDSVKDILYVYWISVYDNSQYRLPVRGERLKHAQKCPRCGSIDLQQHGYKLPNFLRVKNNITCKKCEHTARKQEFGY